MGGEAFIRELCVALEHRWNPDAVFMIFTAYLDEADTHGRTPHMIMAGFLGSGRQWQLFMRRLRQMQRENGFSILHTTEFKHHSGEFAGWGDAKSLTLAYNLTDVVARELEQGVTFDLTHERYIAEYRNTPNPKGIPYDSQYGLCFRYVLSHLINKVASARQTHRLHVVLERGHPNACNCEKIFDETKLTLKAKGIELLGDFTLARKDEAAPLMVADFLAHSYLMLRQSGEFSTTLDERSSTGLSEKRDSGLLYLGLKPDAIHDLKRRLQEDRWLRQAYQKRLRASALASGKVSDE